MTSSTSSRKRKLPKGYAQVDELRAKRPTLDGKSSQFLVKWTGEGEENNSWVDYNDIGDDDLITALEKDSKVPWTWQYFVPKVVNDKPVGWHDFDAKAAESVETAYLKWLSSPFSTSATCPVAIGKYQYDINFTTMKQRNVTHHDHTERQLRRVRK